MISRSFKTTALVAAILGTIGAAHATSLLPGTGPVAIDTADLPAGTFIATATGTVNGGGLELSVTTGARQTVDIAFAESYSGPIELVATTAGGGGK